MAKYLITYSVELDKKPDIDNRLEAYYWHERTLRDTDFELPEHVLWVNTMPEIQEVD